MTDQMQVKMSEAPPNASSGEIIDHKDLAVLWAIGILVSLLFSLVGTSWNPDRYDAIQSGAVDETEAMVENSQNQLVATALNNREIEYHPSMDKLVQLKPGYARVFVDLVRLILFPSGPITIIGLLIKRSFQHSKQKRAKDL